MITHRGEASCVEAFYTQIEEDGGSLPNTYKMKSLVWDFLKNSMEGIEGDSGSEIKKNTYKQYLEAVSETLKAFSSSSIRKNHPEYYL